VNDNSEIKELYEKLLTAKNVIISEKDVRIKLLEDLLNKK